MKAFFVLLALAGGWALVQHDGNAGQVSSRRIEAAAAARAAVARQVRGAYFPVAAIVDLEGAGFRANVSGVVDSPYIKVPNRQFGFLQRAGYECTMGFSDWDQPEARGVTCKILY
jgi:hypothetical protein